MNTQTTYTSTSKKFNEMVKTHEALYAEKGGNRYCQVWWDYENQEWVLQCGYVMMPVDYTEKHTDLAELEKSMRDFVNFRRWTWQTWE